MADFTIATGDAMTRKTWHNRFWMEAKLESYFLGNMGFVGTDETQAILVEIGNLQKEQGDVVNYGDLRDLTGNGVTGDNEMEGNEEVPDLYDDDVTLNQKRNAIRLDGRLTGQRSADAKLKEKANMLLKRWMAMTIDNDIFTAFGTSPTKVIYGGDATSTASIEAGDYFTLALIAKCSAYAAKATPRIVGPMSNRVRLNGVVVISPDQKFDLTQRDAAWSDSRMNAATRGQDNPIFTGALGMEDNVPIHSHPRVSVATNWGGGTLAGATALFMGVGAGVLAWAKKEIYNAKTFDYSNKTGFCMGSLYGTSKSVMNSADRALVAVRTYRTNN
jgi:N4-gp56 family major capsid protein